MTYCVAMHLADGLVFVSDSRTNAGIDQISTFRKLFIFSTPDERLIVLQSAGNLATSQSVINLLRQRCNGTGDHLLNVRTLYDATVLVAETVREVVTRDRSKLASKVDLSCSFLVGGQIMGGPMGSTASTRKATSSRPPKTRRSCNWAKASTASRSSIAT